jgi:alpha-beta hydrolase superfamily lysophospholipase
MPAGAQPDLEATLDRQGLRLHVEHFRPPAPAQLSLVTVHGFSAHCGLYRHVGAALAARGIAVTAFDCRGHGRSDGRRGHVEAFDDFVADLGEVVAWARQREPGLPWAVLGHSLGGTIALAFALADARADRPAALVLVAPWLKLRMKVPAPKRLAANLLARVLPTLSLANGLRAEEISRNPEVRAGFYQDPLVHHTASAGWFMATLRAQAYVRTHAEQLGVPTLMLLAGDDRIVANDANLAFARSAGATVEVRTYDGLYHELYLEPEAERVIADIGGWLLRRQAAVPAVPASG